MIQNITIPSADTIRTMIADLEATSTQVLTQYERNVEANPGDYRTDNQAETLRDFRRNLTRWEARFETEFKPRDNEGKNGEENEIGNEERAETGRSPEGLQDESHYSPRSYTGMNNSASASSVYVTVYRPQGIQQDPLNPRFELEKLEKYSPTGFSWGHPGAGSEQLALAILAHHTGNDEYARAYYQEFKKDVVSKLPWKASWSIDEEQVAGWVKDHKLTPPRKP